MDSIPSKIRATESVGMKQKDIKSSRQPYQLQVSRTSPETEKSAQVEASSNHSGSAKAVTMSQLALAKPPSHTTSNVWRSPSTILSDDFQRMKRLMKHVAPEHFKSRGHANQGCCGIVPTTLVDYIEHRAAMLNLCVVQAEKNRDAKNAAKLIKETHPPVKSKLGSHAKVYSDGFSPILYQRTIWSAEYRNLAIEPAEWPMAADFMECGDKRGNTQVAMNCGRFLPPPKEKIRLLMQNATDSDRGIPASLFVKKVPFRFDEIGPVFSEGPRPWETMAANMDLDCDEEFGEMGGAWIGGELMEEM